jgi:hypothetical protein
MRFQICVTVCLISGQLYQSISKFFPTQYFTFTGDRGQYTRPTMAKKRTNKTWTKPREKVSTYY